jgi:hypothetical protein
MFADVFTLQSKNNMKKSLQHPRTPPPDTFDPFEAGCRP